MYQVLLDKLPPYDTCTLPEYGEVLKDSQLAPPGIALRHPSVLMPVFPVGEINRHSPDKELGVNTLRFAQEQTELGVFGFGWLSCAASRLGMGTAALRLLNEKGLNLILRANGMGAEETDRWLNHCCVGKPPYYYPFMMECVGEVVAGVNEMLLQGDDGIIYVFPAVPTETWKNTGRRGNLFRKPNAIRPGRIVALKICWQRVVLKYRLK